LIHFWVRWVHTVSMGVLLGGTALMWAGTFRPHSDEAGVGLRSLAERFELLFWLAIGVQVMTGIGNMGAYGAALPDPASAWGGKMLLKLVLVLGLLLLSMLRTVIVARRHAQGVAVPRPLASALYGTTAVLLAAIVYLAVSLAHE
jgi:hypothetical protein